MKCAKDKKQGEEQYDTQVQSELLRFRGIPPLERHANPSAWSMGHREQLPPLKELASRVLCIPAFPASSERLFSKTELTLMKKSTRVTQLVTVRSAVASRLLDNT